MEPTSAPELYQELGVPVNASAAEISRAFRVASLRLHPDRHASLDAAAVADAQSAFQRLQAAYRVLGDDDSRDAYDVKHGLNFHRRIGHLRSAVSDAHTRHDGKRLRGDDDDDQIAAQSADSNNKGEDDDDDAEYDPATVPLQSANRHTRHFSGDGDDGDSDDDEAAQRNGDGLVNETTSCGNDKFGRFAQVRVEWEERDVHWTRMAFPIHRDNPQSKLGLELQMRTLDPEVLQQSRLSTDERGRVVTIKPVRATLDRITSDQQQQAATDGEKLCCWVLPPSSSSPTTDCEATQGPTASGSTAAGTSKRDAVEIISTIDAIDGSAVKSVADVVRLTARKCDMQVRVALSSATMHSCTYIHDADDPSTGSGGIPVVVPWTQGAPMPGGDSHPHKNSHVRFVALEDLFRCLFELDHETLCLRLRDATVASHLLAFAVAGMQDHHVDRLALLDAARLLFMPPSTQEKLHGARLLSCRRRRRFVRHDGDTSDWYVVAEIMPLCRQDDLGVFYSRTEEWRVQASHQSAHSMSIAGVWDCVDERLDLLVVAL